MMRQLFEYHPVIGYRFIPALTARIPHEGGGYLIRVNGDGFRCDHEFFHERRPDTRRVLLFGDSYTAGEGVSNGKRYGDLIEQRIAGIEVYNYALPGTGTDQHYLIFREFAAGVEKDLTIIAVLVENIRRIVCRYRPYMNEQGEQIYFEKPYYELQDRELVLHGIPPNRLPLKDSEIPKNERHRIFSSGRYQIFRSLVSKLGLKDLAQSVTRYQPLPEYDDPENDSWLLLKAILEHWISRNSGKVIVMPIPLHQYIEETADPASYQARFGELAKVTGCMLHDPLPDLLRYSPRERRGFRFEQDVHLTPKGHGALADSLVPVVRRVLSMPQ